MINYTNPTAIDLYTGFVVTVRIIAKDSEADAVANILESLIKPSMAETRMKFFMPYRSPNNPAEFLVYELYENEAAWDAHNKSAHLLNVVDDLISKAIFRERVPFLPFVN